MLAAYDKCEEVELGMVLAERLAALGLQSNDAAAIRRVSRQIGILAQHWQMLELTKIVPPPPLTGNTRVLLALSKITEDDQQGVVRDFYRSNLFEELICDGVHIDVCVRCSMNEDPPFTAALTNFLRALDDEGRQPE